MSVLSPFPALLQALDDRMIHGVNAHTLHERYGCELTAATKLVGDNHKKGQTFALALRLVVLGVDGTCDQQWHELAEAMIELQPSFCRDDELEKLHLVLRSFPEYAHHFRQRILGQSEPWPSGVCLWN